MRGALCLSPLVDNTQQERLSLREVSGALGRYPLEEGIRLLKRNTRRHVKRQLSWLRNEPGVNWVQADQLLDTVEDEIMRAYKSDKM